MRTTVNGATVSPLAGILVPAALLVGASLQRVDAEELAAPWNQASGRASLLASRSTSGLDPARQEPRPTELTLMTSLASGVAADAPSLGIFTDHADLGAVQHPGSVRYDASSGTYLVTGGGENMWFTNDACHFVWKSASGDLAVSADIRWPTPGGNAHRKACLIIRQSTAADAPYADAVLHGDGLTSLQYREETGGPTREIQANLTAPSRLRIEKRGDYVSMSIARAGDPLAPAGGSFRLRLQEPFLVGLAVCAHDNARIETAEFSNVRLDPLPSIAGTKLTLHSTLETIVIASKDRRVVWHTTNHLEAPNWSPDGAHLLVNAGGLLYRVPVAGGPAERLDTGFAVRCNNDHGYSPDGQWLAISDQSQGDRRSRIYVLSAAGGTPRLVTPLGPSYWHGWSPDGRTLAYCAERGGEYDIYTIPAEGGTEIRLTTAPGLDDGPDFSPDGRWIYFNSERTGHMQIWRMRPDGTGPEPVTHDDWNNWFPHPSPDGRWLAFLSYEPDVKGHPENRDVMLRLLPLAGGDTQVLAKLFGGQGTINVPSWSPDSRRLAFVSYGFFLNNSEAP